VCIPPRPSIPQNANYMRCVQAGACWTTPRTHSPSSPVSLGRQARASCRTLRQAIHGCSLPIGFSACRCRLRIWPATDRPGCSFPDTSAKKTPPQADSCRRRSFSLSKRSLGLLRAAPLNPFIPAAPVHPAERIARNGRFLCVLCRPRVRRTRGKERLTRQKTGF